MNELRAEQGYEALNTPLGDAPLNPSLIGPWMQVMQGQQPEDYGDPQEQEEQEEPKGDGGETSESDEQEPPNTEDA